MADAASGEALPAGAPRLGTLLAEKYLLEGVLGIGGMGVVYRSNHALLGVPVAVKIILPEFAARPEFVTRFTNEARAAARIQSDNIARVSDVGTTKEGISFLVMELLDGEDLGSILAREGPQPPERCVDWMLQAIAGLSDAHAAGIIHRDLKPSNLFLVRRKEKGDRIKICDFGISKGTFDEGSSQLTKTNTMLGSPAYMAPEQLRSSRTVDARADLWSLGIILYELLTGSTPFTGENIGAVFAAILENDPLPVGALLPSIPEELDRAILRCLRRSPSERFGSAAELGAALAPFASDGGIKLLRRLSRRPEAGLGLSRTTPHYDSGSHPIVRSPFSEGSAPSSPSTPTGGNTPVGTVIPNTTQRLSNATPPPGSARPLSSHVAPLADVLPSSAANSHSTSGSSDRDRWGGVAGLSGSVARTDPSRQHPPPRRGLPMALVAFALVLCSIGTALIVHYTSSSSASATTTTTSTSTSTTASASASSTVVIVASPPDAKLFLDDAPLLGNPATVTLARGDRHPHRIHADATDHVPVTQVIEAETAPPTITLKLERVAVIASPPTGSPATGPSPAVAAGGRPTPKGARRPETPPAPASAIASPPALEAKPSASPPPPPTTGASSGPSIYTDPWKTN